MQALAGKLDSDPRFTGSIRYNGRTAKEALDHGIHTSRLSVYVDQLDVHIAQLTVKVYHQRTAHTDWHVPSSVIRHAHILKVRSRSVLRRKLWSLLWRHQYPQIRFCLTHQKHRLVCFDSRCTMSHREPLNLLVALVHCRIAWRRLADLSSASAAYDRAARPQGMRERHCGK